MKKSDKIVASFYVVLAVSLISVYIYVDNSIGRSDIPDILPKALSEVTVIKTVNLNVEEIFEVMTDVRKYPLILPKNIISVKILNETNNVVFAEEELAQSPVRTKLVVKHTFDSDKKHTIEIIEGDAKGTIVIQTFEEVDSETKITTNITFNLSGPLVFVKFFPESNVQHALTTVIDNFVEYARGFSSESEKIVDDLYREILLRPADPEGLKHFATLLDNEKMNKEEIRNALLESDEFVVLSSNIEELSEESKKIVDDLYKEILRRPADPEGLKHFATLLEYGKITEEEIRNTLLNSEERKSFGFEAEN